MDANRKEITNYEKQLEDIEGIEERRRKGYEANNSFSNRLGWMLSSSSGFVNFDY